MGRGRSRNVTRNVTRNDITMDMRTASDVRRGSGKASILHDGILHGSACLSGTLSGRTTTSGPPLWSGTTPNPLWTGGDRTTIRCGYKMFLVSCYVGVKTPAFRGFCVGSIQPGRPKRTVRWSLVRRVKTCPVVPAGNAYAGDLSFARSLAHAGGLVRSHYGP